MVTYRPDLPLVTRALETIAPQVGQLFVVDNGSGPEAVTALREVLGKLGETGSPRSELIDLGENLGIATAQNRGIKAARAGGAEAVLLLDHDSLSPEGMVQSLLDSYSAGLAQGLRVGAVGPMIQEQRAEDLLVYGDTFLGPRRLRDITPGEDAPAAFLLASGCLIPISVLAEVGPMNQKFFIDHVDLEWGVRARNAGYVLLASYAAQLEHHLGDEVVKIPGRAQPVHVHSPIRCYYLARNTIALIRGRVVPGGWKLGYVIWLAKYAGFNSLVVPPRWERFRLLARGVWDGIRGRGGPFSA